VAGLGCRSDPVAGVEASTTEWVALSFLSREVPSWSQENGCFSCHNNGDAARALYCALGMGYNLPGHALTETSRWLAAPSGWQENKGEPGVSDEGLARIQFAAALAEARRGNAIRDDEALARACELVAQYQGPDGSWVIEPKDALGTPATYGTYLATAMALGTLREAKHDSWSEAIERGENWLRRAPVRNVLEASSVLLGLQGAPKRDGVRERCLALIRRSQSSEGGWGPYADTASEPFDTAIVLLALLKVSQAPGVDELIRSGRAFLLAGQLDDGGWVETTRPPGGISYAQRLSTTGWVTEALLRTGTANGRR